MLAGLLIILGVYGSCIAMVHAAHAFHTREEKAKATRLVLVTRNSQAEIEWYLWSFLFVSWIRGKQIRVTVFDDGSTDDTPAIVRKMAVGRGYMEWVDSADTLNDFLAASDGEAVLLVRLDRGDRPLRNLPQW